MYEDEFEEMLEGDEADTLRGFRRVRRPSRYSRRPVPERRLASALSKRDYTRIKGLCGTNSEGMGLTHGKILPQFWNVSIEERRAIVDEICGRKKPPLKRIPHFPPHQRVDQEEFNRRRAARAKEIAAQIEPVNGKCPAGYHLGWALRPILLPGMVGMPQPRMVCHPDKPGKQQRIPDDAARKKLKDEYNIAKGKYELLITEGKTIRDQYRRKNAEISAARKVLANIQRQLKIKPQRYIPERLRYRRR